MKTAEPNKLDLMRKEVLCPEESNFVQPGRPLHELLAQPHPETASKAPHVHSPTLAEYILPEHFKVERST